MLITDKIALLKEWMYAVDRAREGPAPWMSPRVDEALTPIDRYTMTALVVELFEALEEKKHAISSVSVVYRGILSQRNAAPGPATTPGAASERLRVGAEDEV